MGLSANPDLEEVTRQVKARLRGPWSAYSFAIAGLTR